MIVFQSPELIKEREHPEAKLLRNAEISSHEFGYGDMSVSVLDSGEADFVSLSFSSFQGVRENFRASRESTETLLGRLEIAELYLNELEDLADEARSQQAELFKKASQSGNTTELERLLSESRLARFK